MSKISVYNSVSLEGFFCGPDGDMSWGHSPDAEWQAFVEENARSGARFIFGRITYELMAGYWPTPLAAKQFPVVADRMNSLPKVVFSKTLRAVEWKNARLAKGDLADEVRAMKREPGMDTTILGSGSIVSQLAKEGLIDEYQLVVCPLLLGRGRPLFEGLDRRLPLKLSRTRVFGNGNVLLCYKAPRA
jgi:dihydrofolate reductase